MTVGSVSRDDLIAAINDLMWRYPDDVASLADALLMHYRVEGKTLHPETLEEIRPVPAPAAADTPGATDDDAAVRLAQGRQWIAHQGVSYLPAWDELTISEQEQATTEARRWLTAAVNTGLLPPARELECPSCRASIRARAVPAPAVDREGLIELIADASNHNPFPEAEDIADTLIEAGLIRGPAASGECATAGGVCIENHDHGDSGEHRG